MKIDKSKVYGIDINNKIIYFDINNDMLKSFSSFRNSTLISLSMAENYETGNINNVDFTKEFYGEGNPELISYFNTNVKVPIGNDFDNENMQQLFYWKPYYDYCFYELGLKLHTFAIARECNI